MSADQGVSPAAGPRSRGDRQRQAIVDAVRELLQEKPFAELSVSTISDRAGVARSGFYFYFDSKYAVLAHILGEVNAELQELTKFFAPRGGDESPAEFARRMVTSATLVYAHNDPVVTACQRARGSDAEIRDLLDAQVDVLIQQITELVQAEVDAGTAHPISDELPALIRMLTATTSFILVGDSTFNGPDGDRDRAQRLLEQLWLHALWSGPGAAVSSAP
ncbi:TetR/AcrR family transcriptional regulator [Mycolicibacterium brumae]|uniref:TetR/AcrR family transcriptional regulator n=1 Tax=Mycolicibacterium brumae TaxID=85968 RepID=A0A2G5P8A9_9MYCO|nr:TetR/AcrR family transcriptional regulator [Mycolicibacterium brumae]MCV7191328.1 TetR/AcrR family transcriptional regulator [Mycolicibacterium brumae]PIB74555.1 TetR/AcrR family transcriptional regulator [Mycolicibacterium brumae]UWW09573.1 TetR/AcrR family transcriptional regulator [Mycolicibacterium brumae]